MRKAVLAGMQDLDQAVDWVLRHGEDAGIDEPISMVSLVALGLLVNLFITQLA